MQVRARARLASGPVVAAVVASTLSLAVPGPAVAGDRNEIQSLLDRRAHAIVSQDREQFISTIAPDRPGWRNIQIDLWHRMRSLPLAAYRLRARWDRLGDLARPSDVASYENAEEIAIPVTEERYRLAGYDSTPSVEDVFFTFVKEDGEWLIASDTDLDDATLYSARHPWDFGAFRTTERGHFLLLEPACSSCARAPAGALALAESALDRVRTYWTAPWRKRIPLIVPTGAGQLKRMLQITFDVSKFVAFAVSSVDLRNGVDYSGHRIVLNPGQFAGRPSDSTLDILAHELVHVATRDVSGPFVPTWVEEGIAEYVGNSGNTAALTFILQEAAAGSFDGRLPESFRFNTGSGLDIYRSYQKSYSAVRYMIERWGLRKFVRFYRRVGRTEVAPGLAEYHVDRALRQTFGVGIDRFERAWAVSINPHD